MCSGARSSSANTARSWRASSARGCATSSKTVRSLWTISGPSDITVNPTPAGETSAPQALRRRRDADDARERERAFDVGAAVPGAETPAADARRFEQVVDDHATGHGDADGHRLLGLDRGVQLPREPGIRCPPLAAVAGAQLLDQGAGRVGRDDRDDAAGALVE